MASLEKEMAQSAKKLILARAERINSLLRVLAQEMLMEVEFSPEAMKQLRDMSFQAESRVREWMEGLGRDVALALHQPTNPPDMEHEFHAYLAGLERAVQARDEEECCRISRQINAYLSMLEADGHLDGKMLQRAIEMLKGAADVLDMAKASGVSAIYLRNIRSRVELLSNFASALGDPPASAPRILLHNVAISISHAGRFRVTPLEGWAPLSVAEESRLAHCPSALWIPSRSIFLPQEIAAFERLINRKPPATEDEFQSFFEDNPKWLYMLGEQYESCRPQIQIPKLQIRSELALIDVEADFSKELRPDFFLKRAGLALWDVLEIKPADCRVLVGGDTRRKYSEEVQAALAQVREYQRRLQQNEIREKLMKNHNIRVASPLAMVLMGRDFAFETLGQKSLLRQQDQMRVYTYDDLHRLAKAKAAFGLPDGLKRRLLR